MADDMPLYQGTKTLRAKPMTKAVYCSLRGWRTPDDEDPNELGYLVEYQDGGKANLEGFEGYVSWSPADVFERSYRECGSHVQRMSIELDELGERTRKLELFIGGSQFLALDEIDQMLLRIQLNFMGCYRNILNQRLTRAL